MAKKKGLEEYETGDQVKHPQWGVGTVLFKNGTGERQKVIVVFPEEGQKKLLVDTVAGGKVTLVFDGDDDGRACQDRCLRDLAPHMFARVIELEDGCQPDHLSDAQLQELLGDK